MHVLIAYIGPRAPSKDPFQGLAAMYLDRISAYSQAKIEAFRTEQALFEALERQRRRSPATIVLLDSRGRQMSSETFADWIARQRDRGAQRLVFAIGPADGWSDESRNRANLLLSLGPMTLAHAVARVVLAEQLYRAFTILAGHPYHSGH